MSYFDSLRTELKPYLKRKEVEVIHRAFLLAEKVHSPQSRQSGEPYITHPVAVATILAKMHMDCPTLIAALLHDVVEDTDVTKQEIAEQFGDEVAALVEGVTKLEKIHFESRAEAQAENFRKMFLAMSEDIRVILIKLADRLHNMQTLEGLSPNKCRRIAQETLDIFAPIAHRLGMNSFRVEFERLGFAALYPLRYRVLKHYVEHASGARQEVMSLIESSLKQCLEQAKIKLVSIKGREKELYSIYKKMRDRGTSIADILDIYGFRVVVHSLDDCYRVLGQVHHLYKPLQARFKDYIAIPKANGYQSLHTTLVGPYGVPVEIQIRTVDMDHVATSGIAAHWLYKSGESVTVQDWIDNLKQVQEKTGSSAEFLEDVKIDLFPDEVYVFTPKGTILKLPAGATPIDFAYAVHTDLGNACVGAKVDRQPVPLTTALLNGQTVEIMTSKEAIPKLSWQDFVVTSKAKSHIRHFFKTRRQEESEHLGQRLLAHAFSELSVNVHELLPESFAPVLTVLEMGSLSELYESIGLGERPARLVAEQYLSLRSLKIALPQKINLNIEPLSIQGSEGVAMQFATCCGPIPGDVVVGYFQENEGLVVHQSACGHIKKYYDIPHQLIPLLWAESVQGIFKTGLHIQTQNEPGVLAALALAIASVDANIANVRAESDENQYLSVAIEVLVTHREHLARVIQSIRHIRRTNPIHAIRMAFNEGGV